MKNKVVITGLGLTTPMGIGVANSWKKATSGRTYIRKIKSIPTETLRTKLAGEITGLNFQDYFPDIRPDRMDRSTLLALVSAQEALKDAGLDSHRDRGNTGVMVGTCFSTVQTRESTYLRLAVTEEGMSTLLF